MKRSLRSWLWRVPLDQEVDEEIALHLELRTRELIQAAWIRPRRVSSRSSGWATSPSSKKPASTSEESEIVSMRLDQWLEELRDDVKFAFRQLRRRRCSRLIAVTTLALGIGANSAIFALVDATLLRPLPYARPGSAGHDLGDVRREPAKLRIAAEHARLEQRAAGRSRRSPASPRASAAW